MPTTSISGPLFGYGAQQSAQGNQAYLMGLQDFLAGRQQASQQRFQEEENRKAQRAAEKAQKKAEKEARKRSLLTLGLGVGTGVAGGAIMGGLAAPAAAAGSSVAAPAATAASTAASMAPAAASPVAAGAAGGGLASAMASPVAAAPMSLGGQAGGMSAAQLGMAPATGPVMSAADLTGNVPYANMTSGKAAMYGGLLGGLDSVGGTNFSGQFMSGLNRVPALRRQGVMDAHRMGMDTSRLGLEERLMAPKAALLQARGDTERARAGYYDAQAGRVEDLSPYQQDLLATNAAAAQALADQRGAQTVQTTALTAPKVATETARGRELDTRADLNVGRESRATELQPSIVDRAQGSAVKSWEDAALSNARAEQASSAAGLSDTRAADINATQPGRMELNAARTLRTKLTQTTKPRQAALDVAQRMQTSKQATGNWDDAYAIGEAAFADEEISADEWERIKASIERQKANQ